MSGRGKPEPDNQSDHQSDHQSDQLVVTTHPAQSIGRQKLLQRTIAPQELLSQPEGSLPKCLRLDQVHSRLVNPIPNVHFLLVPLLNATLPKEIRLEIFFNIAGLSR